MSNEEANKLPCGIYRIWWNGGCKGVAGVGRNREGRCWLMPTNWVSGPTLDYWDKIERVELVERNFEDCDG